ncbi:MAG: regulator [Candidatus Thermoplasmatota archaeon]|nr:regulator [Candidatus Thermoplasmatota archaeon]MBU1940785.1 regulator [Candidatus Thermoplasmatota archaeon]
MWQYIARYFNAFPKQKIIAQKMLEYGLHISQGKLFCGTIELSPSKIARAFNTDRRIVMATIETIEQNPRLSTIFSQLSPTCHLKNVAPAMNWGVLEIIPEDPSMPGILAEISTIIATHNISIRQAIVDDFELTEAPRLFIITEKPIPGSLIPIICQAQGVKAVQIS